MAGYCMHSSHVGVLGHTHVHAHRHIVRQTPIRQGVTVHSLSRPYRKSTRRGQLHVLAASSTDVHRQDDVTRSAQDLAQGVQDFLEESQKALQLNPDDAPLPEHPVGEEGEINVAENIDASVRTAAEMAGTVAGRIPNC